MKEIERKFLIDKFPDEEIGDHYYCFDVQQSYISIDPEVRIRRSGSVNMLCIKSDGSIEREEIEIRIGAQKYDYLRKLVGLHNHSIYKYIRLYLLDSGETLEVSYVDPTDDNNRFMYAEIEFESIEEANAFVPPYFLGKEVTNDPAYKMKNYWKRTRLEQSRDKVSTASIECREVIEDALRNPGAMRWNGTEWDICLGYPIGHVHLSDLIFKTLVK